jgi:ring-1,2-phenylacetyl-CoA epoxidase subunit PaaC
MNHIKELITKMADDALIIGHRNSEWTGLGPILEEDISFSSMAQDKVGHALGLYSILHDEFKEKDPDTFAFHRKESEFKCCHLVELPIGEYDFSVVRHFLFDHAEKLRYELLESSSFEPLAKFAKKIHGEIKYHIFHADSWINRLGNANEESKGRMQSALNHAFIYALGIFEPGDFENQLISEKVFIGEKGLQALWLEKITSIINKAGLKIPDIKNPAEHYGGRKGYHTEYLKPLLTEMTEVVRFDESANW